MLYESIWNHESKSASFQCDSDELPSPRHLLTCIYLLQRCFHFRYILLEGFAFEFLTTVFLQMGMDGVFVGSGIFKSGNPQKRAEAIVKAVTHYNDAKMLAAVSEDLGEAMVGINSGEGYLLFSHRDS